MVSQSDPFHNVIETKSGNFVCFDMHKRKDMMKCPVYDRINCTLGRIVIRIARRFIEDLIDNFPSASDLNMFDFEGEQTAVETEEFGNEVVMNGFYGHLSVEPFSAMLSYRSKGTGFFGEILDREFQYSGLDCWDAFGTREQMKQWVKGQLRTALIYALPRMVLPKRE
jgi:hypothetical protein